jgi:hypothetical protein
MSVFIDFPFGSSCMLLNCSRADCRFSVMSLAITSGGSGQFMCCFSFAHL